MVPQKDSYSQEEVDRMLKDARVQIQLEILNKDFNDHKESVERTLTKILDKISIIMDNDQMRSKELTEFQMGLKKEFSEDFVTKEEFKSMKRSIVLAVTIVMGIGAVIQWVLSTYAMAIKAAGAG